MEDTPSELRFVRPEAAPAGLSVSLLPVSVYEAGLSEIIENCPTLRMAPPLGHNISYEELGWSFTAMDLIQE